VDNVNERTVDTRKSISNQLLPRFKDESLEHDYITKNLLSKGIVIRVGALVAAIMFLAVEPLAKTMLPEEAHALDHYFRWYLQTPLTLIAFLFVIRTRNPVLVERVMLTVISVAHLSTTVLVWMSGNAGWPFYDFAIYQILIFGFLIMSLRFRTTFICCAALTLIHVAVVAALGPLEVSPGVYLPAYQGNIFFMAVIGFAAYSIDMSNRATFLSTLALNREYDERITVQNERNRWLGIITDFLRHELKNSLIGVTSSLELIRRRNKNEDLKNYIHRAENSTRFMKRLLDEASAATSLESALDSIELERIDLTHLLETKLIDYREMYPEFTFQSNTQTSIHISCDIERIVQVLDKLINNAIEHGDAAYPIIITLEEANASTILKVADTGDLLVSDEYDIFAPFVSRKSRSSEGGFGFGLYIVKRVIEAHGGTVSAKSLGSPEGAEFTIVLPGPPDN
jgi:signal transduction histidine kinase